MSAAVQLAVVVALLLAIATIAVSTISTGISPMPSSPRARAAVIELMPAHVVGPIFELGAGWGTLALPLARARPDCRVVALELSPLPWLVLRARAATARLPNLEVRRTDFHHVALTGAGAVVCYLYPGAMARLRPKLEAELPPGAVVISNTFAVPGWQPVRVVRLGDWFATPVYGYRVPQPDAWTGSEQSLS